MIPSAVFVVAVALQTKSSRSNFREILGVWQRLLHMFCRPRENARPGFSWKALGSVQWCN